MTDAQANIGAKVGATAQCDVLVVGGGLVGALGALLFAQQSKRVVLLEIGSAPAMTEQPLDAILDLDAFPIRHVALSPASVQLLQGVDAWSGIRGTSYTAMDVWEQRGTANLGFRAAEAGVDNLGWVVEHDDLLRHLWRRVRQNSNITVHTGMALQALVATQIAPNVPDSLSEGANSVVPVGWRATFSAAGVERGSKFDLETELVIGADGAASHVRKLGQGSVQNYPTGHVALATVVRTECPHDSVARQRFLHEGPLALLPSREPNIVSIVWSMSATAAKRRRDMAAQEFCTELTAASERVLGQTLAVGQRATFPAAQQLARRFQPQPGILLVGDAARVLHPLAGQGVNAGFEDIAAVASSPRQHLGRVAAQRRARARTLIFAMDGLRRIYGGQGLMTSLLRNNGVRLVQGSTLLKRIIMGQALGSQ